MKTDLIGEDVVVRISTPQIITGEAPGAGGRAGAGSAAAECGRRLLLAAGKGDSAAVRALMAKGAPFTADWLGTSPLHLAAANDHADTVAVLLRAGVSRDARTKVERTPLHLAAGAGHAAAAAALLDAGAAVDARDMLGMTPLHWAAQRGHARVARLLLAHGAAPALRSKFRLTPRDVASRAGRADIVRLLDDAERLRDERDEARERDAARGRDAAGEAPAPPPADAPAEPAAGEALLRRHGITLLPADDAGTVLRALHSGRTVVLSDAGKLMLKESATGAASTGGAPASAAGGVVLTATPARSPPAPGVKVFTLSAAGRLAPPRAPAAPAPPVAPAAAPPSAPAPAPPPADPAAAAAPAASRPAVKIIMNRANFRKLVASAAPAEEPPAEAEGPLRVPEQFLRSSSAGYLRAQLLAAHAALHALTAELRAVRGRLARYEPPDER